MHEERGGSTPRPVQNDEGEGTSTGFDRLTGMPFPYNVFAKEPPLIGFGPTRSRYTSRGER